MASRRRFIRDCSALAVSAAIVPSSLVAAPRRLRAGSLAEVDFNAFAAEVNSDFLARDADGATQPLALVEAVVRGERPADDPGGEAFSLLFRGDAARPLRQDTYSFEHARIGRFEMFIVPVGREDEHHRCYEAVFNRRWTMRGPVANPRSEKEPHG